MKLKCPNPHCGNENVEDMFLGEWVPSQRRIYGVKGEKVYASEEADEIMESAKDEHIFCNSCCQEFDIPKGMKSEIGDVPEEGAA